MIIYETDHYRNKVVMRAFYQGLRNNGVHADIRLSYDYRSGKGPVLPAASYGVLRGVDQIYWDCEAAGVDWWNVDRGFFAAEHFDGYYRIGYIHLQPCLPARNIEISPERWERLNVPFAKDYVSDPRRSYVLVCPPTPAMASFYKIDIATWVRDTSEKIPWKYRKRLRVRAKSSSRDLEDDLKGAVAVVAFNSNVAMKALLLGIPAVTETGLINSWNRMGPENVGRDLLRSFDRLKLFRFAANVQFLVDEIASGFAWESLRKIYQWKEDPCLSTT